MHGWRRWLPLISLVACTRARPWLIEMPRGEGIPSSPLPLPRYATIALVDDGTPRVGALSDALRASRRHLVRYSVADLIDRPGRIAADVVVAGSAVDELLTLAPRLTPGLDGAVLVCATVDERRHDTRDRSPDGESIVVHVAASLPRARVVGALQQFDVDHLALIGLGMLETDAPVTGDDREAVDLVEALLDEIPGVSAVFAGPLRNAGAIEGISVVLRSLGQAVGRPIGFRLDPARGLVFLHGRS